MRGASITQQALAEKTGLTQATISRLLHGQDPKAQDLYKLSDFFSAPMDWLLVGTVTAFPGEVVQRAVAAQIVEILDALSDEISAKSDAAFKEVQSLIESINR